MTLAGFFGFFDYTKPGKGVNKDEPKKKGILRFFELFFPEVLELHEIKSTLYDHLYSGIFILYLYFALFIWW